eukprot:3023060-Prymnesium_polylepis.1
MSHATRNMQQCMLNSLATCDFWLVHVCGRRERPWCHTRVQYARRGRSWDDSLRVSEAKRMPWQTDVEAPNMTWFNVVPDVLHVDQEQDPTR